MVVHHSSSRNHTASAIFEDLCTHRVGATTCPSQPTKYWYAMKCEFDVQMWGWCSNMSLTFTCEIDIQIWAWCSNVFVSQMWVWHSNMRLTSKYEFDILMCLMFKYEFDIQMWDWHPNLSLTFKGVSWSNVSLTFKCEIDVTSIHEFDIQMCLMFKCEIDIQIWDWCSNTNRLTVKHNKYFWHCSPPIDIDTRCKQYTASSPKSNCFHSESKSWIL